MTAKSVEELRAKLAELTALKKQLEELELQKAKKIRLPKTKPMFMPRYGALKIPEGMSGDSLSRWFNTQKKLHDNQ